MSSEGNRGRATDGEAIGRGNSASPRARAVVRTADSSPGESLAMGAADTHMASSGGALAAVAAPGQPEMVDVRADTETPHDATLLQRDSSAEGKPAEPNGDKFDSGPEGDDPLIGKNLLGRYQVTAKIGQGGMGAVYEATHIEIGKRVAIKVLLAKYLDRDQVVARLKQEARLASSIGHEHIIDITDLGVTHDGRTFVVMEYLEGESLGACIQRDGPMPEQRAIRIAHQIASALHAAHEKGIIHRDVKPENVFLLERKNKDFVKVVDFGISKSLSPDEESGSSPRLTQTGMVLGTPLYMSPEQARGSENLDRRIDVYSLGVIMYEMLTGEVPFHGSNYLSIISQVLNEEPQHPSELRPGVSQELEDVILRALEKDPERRYQSCEELAADLDLLIEDPGRTTMRGRVSASKYRRKRERRAGLTMLGWTAGVAVTISAVVVTVVMLMGNPNNNPTDPDERPVTVISVPIDAAPAQEIDAAPVPSADLVEVSFVSNPTGATIYQGARRIGTTPFSRKFVRKDEKVKLVAELAGHDDAEFEINPLADHVELTEEPVLVKLSKPAKGAKIKKIRKKPRPDKNGKNGENGNGGGNDNTDGDLPEGIKGNPFENKGRDGRNGR